MDQREVFEFPMVMQILRGRLELPAQRLGNRRRTSSAFQARYGLRISGLLNRDTRQELLPGLDQDEFDP
jgi:hypothetical protein